MIQYLIKNNMKLMFRDKWIIAILVLGPMLVIAILSSAFADLLKSYEGVDKFNVGYRIEEGSVYEDTQKEILQAAKEAGITFSLYGEGEPKEVMNANHLAAFVELSDGTYHIYKSADYEAEGIALEFFLNRIMKESTNAVLEATMPSFEKETNTLPVRQLDFMPAIDATDYYGITFIVYFCWCGLICAATVLNNEKKYGIERRYRVSAISEWKLYLSKYIPLVIVVIAGMGFTTFVTIVMYGIHWGNAILSAVLLFATILASTAYGLMLYYIFRNLAITVISLFTSGWLMGYFGGSFETYMYAPDIGPLKEFSPHYYSNRSLVELSCMGHSNYVGSCLLYMAGITVVCILISLAVATLRKRGRA